ncbi:MAG: T9SS type A sorting domain-containing protein [Saprospiraceae bacterium]
MKNTFYKSNLLSNVLSKYNLCLLLFFGFLGNNTLHAQDCSNIQFSENNSQLIIDGLIAPIVIVDVYDPDWNPIFDCGVTNCGPQILVPNLSNGEHHIIIKLFTANWSKICERTDDFTITGVISGNQADLTVSNFQNLPSTAKIGEVKTFNFDLNNFGNGTANGAYQVDVYLSANQDLNINQYTPGTPFVKVGAVNTGNTPIGTIQDVVGACNVPSGTALGPYYLVLIADGAEVIAESNESNNVLVSNQILTISGEGNTGGGNTLQCGEITINYGNGSIEMTGNSSSNYFFKIHDLNANWAEVFSCAYQCGSSQTATGLANGDYLVRAYNSSWGQICEQEINLTEGGGSSGEGCGSFEDKFTYQATSYTETASFTEDAGGYDACFRLREGRFTKIRYYFDGEKLNTNFVSIEEPSGTFTYTGKDYYYTYSRQNKLVTLSKKDLSGNPIWSRNYTLNNSDNVGSTAPFSFKEMDNSLVLIARYSLFQSLSRRQTIIKTDLSGNEIWQQAIPIVEDALEFYRIDGEAQDGGYYLSKRYRTNFIELVKLRENGTVQWTKTLTNIYQLDDVLFVDKSTDGTAAYYYYLRPYEVPVSLIKINSSNGSTLWDKTLPDLFSPNKNIRTSFRRGAVLTSDGGIVASYYYNSAGTSGGAEYGKLDADGNFLWRQEVADSRNQAYTPILGTTDGGVIFWDRLVNVMLGVAKVTADGTFDPTCSGNTMGGNTIQCGEITINYEGATINMQGQSGNNYFFKIYDLADNWNEVFSCSYNCGSSQTATINRNGAYLVRGYNDSWEQICEQEIRLDDAGQRSSRVVRTFSVFPNPAQEVIAIDLNEYAGGQAAISISNMYGQIVQQKQIMDIPFEAIKFPLDNFVNGFYFINIKLENKRLRSEKFLVKRLY